MKNCNKYRVSVYLGKELHGQMEQLANALGIPLSTTIKIILSSGMMFEQAFVENNKGGIRNEKD